MGQIKKIILIILLTLIILVPTLVLAGLVADRNIEQCDYPDKSSLECLQQGRDTGFIPFMSIMFIGCLFYGAGIICVLSEEKEEFDESELQTIKDGVFTKKELKFVKKYKIRC